MSRKLLICPWFGDQPSWAELYHERTARLAEYGFDFLHDNNLQAFAGRVERKLGIVCPITPGSAKIHDYRPAFGQLYSEELEGYDWWGHTDYDVVFGRVEQFYDEELLDGFDVVTDNCFDYLCGPWTLYRNSPTLRTLFLKGDWQWQLTSPTVSGWVETEFTEIVRRSVHTRRTAFHEYLEPETLTTDGDKLLHRGSEVPFFHFRRRKEWPL